MRLWHAVAFLVLGCSGGDLTLPDDAEPGESHPASLVIVSGDEQRAEAGTLLDRPLVVRVLDSASNPLHDTPVEFAFVGDLPGAGLDPDLTATDDGGLAEAVVRLGSVAGEQLIVARVTGSASPNLSVRFSATALPAGGGDGDDGDDDDDDGDDDGPGDGVDVGPAPDPLDIDPGHYPPAGSCRVWIRALEPGRQASPESCSSAEQHAPADSWILFRPADGNELHVLVVHPGQAGIIVRVWIYDAGSRRLLSEREP